MSDKTIMLHNQQEAYTREQIELIKNTIAKGATDDELKMFISISQKYGLDPLVKEIWFIKRAKKVKTGNTWDYPRLSNGEIDYSNAETLIMTSRDGYLKVAQRDNDYDGIIGFPVREGDIFEIDAQNYQVTHKFGIKRGKIIGAWAKVDHKRRKPVIVYADFTEYCPTNNNVWNQYPSAMIQKVAEVLALKRQFGISGLVTKEEMTIEAEEPIVINDVKPLPPKEEPTKPIECIDGMVTHGQLDEIKGLAKDFQFKGADLKGFIRSCTGSNIDLKKINEQLSYENAEKVIAAFEAMKQNMENESDVNESERQASVEDMPDFLQDK